MKIVKKIILLCCFSIIIFFVNSKKIDSKASEYRTVKVGYVNTTNFSEGTSDKDNKSGYAYEYLQKVAAYSDWQYEYIYGDWTDIMEKLKFGQIDIMAGVSYTEELEKYIDYPDYSMGFENYYIYTYSDKPFVDIDSSQWKGITIGCVADTMQQVCLKEWNKENGKKCNIVAFDGKDSLYKALANGKVDAIADTDNTIISESKLISLVFIGKSDYYIGVSKNNHVLLKELNSTLEKMTQQEPQWINSLHEKYFNSTNIRMIFSETEKQWLEEHTTIRIGYEKDFLAFCGYDEATGEMVGALRTFVDSIEKDFADSNIHFDVIAYDTVEDSLKALENDEVDTVFPIYTSLSEAENRQLLVSNKIADTDMTAIIHNKDFNEFDDNTVAVTQGFTDILWYLKENYPNWNIVEYDSFVDCLHAVKSLDADCVIESTYVYKTLVDSLSYETISLSKDSEICFVTKKEDSSLFFLLNRLIAAESNVDIIVTLSQYSNPSKVLTLRQFIDYYSIEVVLIACLIVTILMFLLFFNIKSQIKLKDALNLAHHDGLTGLYNRSYYSEVTANIMEKDCYENLTVISLDINRLKSINDTYGHEVGDEIIVVVAKMIKEAFYDDEAFRTGGDEFVIISNRKDINDEIERFKNKVSQWKGNPIETISISLGFASRKEFDTSSYMELFNIADQRMYKDKDSFYRTSGFDRRRNR